MSAFIDENIWEFNLFPRSGRHFNKYTLADIYHYNSENTERYNHPKQNIQIPESLILGKKLDKEFIVKNKEFFVKNKFFAIINIEGEQWAINHPQLDYLRYHLTKEK
jgi:hypothetical protein